MTQLSVDGATYAPQYTSSASSAQGRVDAASSKAESLGQALLDNQRVLADIQQLIAELEVELAALEEPSMSAFYHDERRVEGEYPDFRTVTARVFDSSGYAAAMRTYRDAVAHIEGALRSAEGRLAQQEQAIASIEQQIANAKQELAAAQSALEEALKNDARALAEAQERYKQQMAALEQLQKEALQTQAAVQKAQDELILAQQQLQAAQTACDKAIAATTDAERLAAESELVAASDSATTRAQGAANYLPSWRGEELLPPVTILSTRDFLDVAPRLESFEDGVHATDSGLLVGFTAGNGQFSPEVATQMYHALSDAGYSDDEIYQQLNTIAANYGLADPFVTPERAAAIATWVNTSPVTADTVTSALLGNDPTLGELSAGERAYMAEQASLVWLSEEGIAAGGETELMLFADRVTGDPALSQSVSQRLAHMAYAAEPPPSPGQAAALATASAAAVVGNPEAATALLDSVGPARMGDYVAAFGLNGPNRYPDVFCPVDARVAYAFNLLEHVGQASPTMASAAFVSQMFAQSTDYTYSMSETQNRHAMAVALANHMQPTDSVARQAEVTRIETLLTSEYGKAVLTSSALSPEARLLNLNVVLQNPSVDAALLDTYHGNLGTVQLHLMMQEINNYPTDQVSPLAQMPAMSPALAAQFPELAALGQPLDAVTLSQNIPEPLSRERAAAYLSAQAEAIRAVGDTDLSRFTGGNTLAAAGFELIAGNPIERAGLDTYANTAADNLDRLAAEILASDCPEIVAQALVLGASQAALFDSSMPVFAEAIARHGQEVVGGIENTLAISEAVVSIGAPILGGIVGGPPGAALFSGISQAALSGIHQYRDTGAVDLGRVGLVFALEMSIGLLAGNAANRVFGLTGSRLLAGLSGGLIEGGGSTLSTLIGDPVLEQQVRDGDPVALQRLAIQFGISFTVGAITTRVSGALDTPAGGLPRSTVVAPGDVPVGVTPETVYVGYFTPFGGRTENTAEQAAKYLVAQIEAGELNVPPGTVFEFVPLQRTQASVDGFIELAQAGVVDGTSPRVLMLGENSQVVSNLYNSPTDVVVETTGHIRPGGGTLDSQAPVDAMAAAGGSRLSDNAGSDYCNLVYTQALSNDLPNSVFVHVNNGLGAFDPAGRFAALAPNPAGAGISIARMVEVWFGP